MCKHIHTPRPRYTHDADPLPLRFPRTRDSPHLMTTLLRSWSTDSQPSFSNHLQNSVKLAKPHCL